MKLLFIKFQKNFLQQIIADKTLFPMSSWNKFIFLQLKDTAINLAITESHVLHLFQMEKQDSRFA